MSHGVEFQALSPGCKIRILLNTITRKTKVMTGKKYETGYTMNGHKSTFSLFSFFFLQSDGVCYTLESDISIGPGSFAGSGP